MSHAATNWAIRQRGLKPATKIVLWQLCDRHHPDNGCFPMQKTLADDCEMSRSTLNLHLDKLEEMGLIRRETSRDKATKQQRPTRYFFAFEDGKAVSEIGENPVSENKTQTVKAVSEKTPKPCPKKRDSRVRKSDSNSVREPVREPVSEAREVLSTVLSEEMADAYIAHRKAKRAKLTAHAAVLIAKKLAGHPSPDAVVEMSIMNGWTGVFPDKVQNSNFTKPMEGNYGNRPGNAQYRGGNRPGSGMVDAFAAVALRHGG